MLRSPRYHTSGKYPLAFSGSCYFCALHAFCSRVILNLKYDGYRANSLLVLGDVESVNLACSIGAHGKLIVNFHMHLREIRNTMKCMRKSEIVCSRRSKL